jgi:hypothetical protein
MRSYSVKSGDGEASPHLLASRPRIHIAEMASKSTGGVLSAHLKSS